MKREVAGFIAILAIVIVIVAVVVLGPWYANSTPWYNPEESLPHLATPAEVPGEQVNATVIGNLSLSVSGSFYTMSPHNGPSTFSFTIDVRVNNTRVAALDDFHVEKVTIFNVNATPVYSFGVEPDGNFSIAANTTWVRAFQNDRDMVSIPPDFLWATYTFARVLVTFDGSTEAILTTPLTMMGHAIE